MNLVSLQMSSDQRTFETSLKTAVLNNEVSIFTQRTDPSSAEQYFQVCYDGPFVAWLKSVPRKIF